MKICYLILCKKNAEQVAALVDQLDDEEVYFCIHVDKNSEISIPPAREIFLLRKMTIVLQFDGAIWGL